MLHHRRRLYFIDRFQARVIFMQWGYLALFIAAQGGLVFAPLGKRLEEGGLVGPEQAATATLFLDLHKTFWPALAVILVIAAAHSVIVSHRLVGPLVRVRHVLRSLCAGERPRRVTFRTKDYLTEEAILLENLSHKLLEREERDAARWGEVRELIEGLEVAYRTDRRDVCGPILEELKRQCAGGSASTWVDAPADTESPSSIEA